MAAIVYMTHHHKVSLTASSGLLKMIADKGDWETL